MGCGKGSLRSEGWAEQCPVAVGRHIQSHRRFRMERTIKYRSSLVVLLSMRANISRLCTDKSGYA